MPPHLNDPRSKNKHKKPKVKPDWVEDWHIKGNDAADKLAEEAARLSAVAPSDATAVI